MAATKPHPTPPQAAATAQTNALPNPHPSPTSSASPSPPPPPNSPTPSPNSPPTSPPPPSPPPPSAPPGTLHLTLGVMRLPDPTALASAIHFLETLDLAQLLRTCQPVPESGIVSPPVVELTGLHAMHAPQRTSVLYAAPEAAGGFPLEAFAEGVRRCFVEERLVGREERGLRLHVTVFNTVYARGRGRGGGRGRGKGKGEEARAEAEASNQGGNGAEEEVRREGSGSGEEGEKGEKGAEPVRGRRPGTSSFLKIDARPLLDLYSDHVWAEMRIEKLSICRMGAKKVFAEDGVTVIDEKYEEVASIPMPTMGRTDEK